MCETCEESTEFHIFTRDDDLFWNRDLGWVTDRDQATRFTDEEYFDMDNPPHTTGFEVVVD